jgi:hypothetical protein
VFAALEGADINERERDDAHESSSHYISTQTVVEQNKMLTSSPATSVSLSVLFSEFSEESESSEDCAPAVYAFCPFAVTPSTRYEKSSYSGNPCLRHRENLGFA